MVYDHHLLEPLGLGMILKARKIRFTEILGQGNIDRDTFLEIKLDFAYGVDLSVPQWN